MIVLENFLRGMHRLAHVTGSYKNLYNQGPCGALFCGYRGRWGRCWGQVWLQRAVGQVPGITDQGPGAKKGFSIGVLARFFFF